jgi:predicted nucleotidyltransferase
VKNIPDVIERILSKFPDIQLCILYGSAATDRLTATSDIDLGIAAHHALNSVEKMTIIESLAIDLGRPVDIVDLQKAVGPILQQILCRGRRVVSKDRLLYANLIKKMLYNQADMMPYYRRILRERRERFIHGKAGH